MGKGDGDNKEKDVKGGGGYKQLCFANVKFRCPGDTQVGAWVLS